MTVTRNARARRRTSANLRSTARIAEQLAILGNALAQWSMRDDSRAHPEARRAADVALDAIAAMNHTIAEVHSALLSQLMFSDKAAAARTAAELAAFAGLPIGDGGQADAEPDGDAAAPVDVAAIAAQLTAEQAAQLRELLPARS